MKDNILVLFILTIGFTGFNQANASDRQIDRGLRKQVETKFFECPGEDKLIQIISIKVNSPDWTKMVDGSENKSASFKLKDVKLSSFNNFTSLVCWYKENSGLDVHVSRGIPNGFINCVAKSPNGFLCEKK